MKVIGILALASAATFGVSLGAGPVFDNMFPLSFGNGLSAQESVVNPSGGSTGTFRIDADVGTSSHDMTGFIQLEQLSAATGADELDLHDFLGIEEESSSRFGATIWLGGLRFAFAYTKLDFDADTVITRTFTFGQYSFNANAPVATTVENTYMRGEFGFHVIGFGDDLVTIGLGLGVHYMDLNFSITGETTVGASTFRQTEEQGVPAPIPSIAAYVGIHPSSSFAIEPTVLIFPSMKVSGVGGSLLDLSVTAKYYIFSNIAIGARAGYMKLSLDADVETDGQQIVADVDLTSTQFSGVIGFSF